jgi:hypothetical protein
MILVIRREGFIGFIICYPIIALTPRTTSAPMHNPMHVCVSVCMRVCVCKCVCVCVCVCEPTMLAKG